MSERYLDFTTPIRGHIDATGQRLQNGDMGRQST
jgi:hypothetical protein